MSPGERVRQGSDPGYCLCSRKQEPLASGASMMFTAPRNVPGLPGTKSGPALQPPTGLQNQAQGNEEEDEDEGGLFRHHPGMTGMMGRGYGHHHGWQDGRPVVHSTIMRIIFGMIDANGDGKVSLEEWQAAQERIFKAMDTDHDGTVSFEEMQAFMHGR